MGINKMNDWRLNGQETYLKNVRLKHIKFSEKTTKSDHEHCEFCMEKISSYPDTAHQGYCTEDEYHWICDECFNDFKSLFQWEMI